MNLNRSIKNYKQIVIDDSNNKQSKNNFTIIFFHGKNHSSLKYNYTFENDIKIRKNYFLDKLANISNLFLYNRPEEILRFNYEENKQNNDIHYQNNTIDSHVKNLYNFLIKEKIKSPYVLVSHSIGSLYALKFAQKYHQITKHVFLIDPIQYTQKVSKMYNSKKLSSLKILKLLQIINNPKSSKKIIEKSLDALDSNTYSIPYFKPLIRSPLTTFFNVNTKDSVHDEYTLPYLKELKKCNPTMTNYFFYDRDHYLNETNPQGIVTKIKQELKE